MRRNLARWVFVAALAIIVAGAASAQSAPPQISTGTTAETAIVLPGIRDEFHGAAAEQAYVAAHFPTWHMAYQSPIEQNGRHYDLLGMIEPDGTKTALYFDTTDWFGK